MTTLQRTEYACPVCDTRFTSQAVASTNSFGGKRTDFHERAAGTQPLPYLLHMCPTCAFTGADPDFTEGDVSPQLKAYVLETFGTLAERAATSVAGAVTGSEKYEVAAKIAAFKDDDARLVADLYLRAAWCCVDEGDREAERYFRLAAARWFITALDGWGDVARDERAVITYLVGELWRRIGNLTEARTWFNLVECEITDRATQQWVLDVARQQRDCPREWFG